MSYPEDINGLAQRIHTGNRHWWYTEKGERRERNKGELLMLMVSEISEAMEGERKDLMDKHLPHRRNAEVELADAVIRILDYAEGFGYNLRQAINEKLEYNRTRIDHTYKHRETTHGKKW